jgi:hypothetical protein
LNPSRRGGKPATNRLSYGAANIQLRFIHWTNYEGGLIILWLYKENNKLRDCKNEFTYSPLSSTRTYNFVVLTHPRKILLVVPQIRK